MGRDRGAEESRCKVGGCLLSRHATGSGGPVVKTLPGNAGVQVGPWSEGSEVPHAVEKPSPRVAATEPARSRARVPQLESPSAATKSHAREDICSV